MSDGITRVTIEALRRIFESHFVQQRPHFGSTSTDAKERNGTLFGETVQWQRLSFAMRSFPGRPKVHFQNVLTGSGIPLRVKNGKNIVRSVGD